MNNIYLIVRTDKIDYDEYDSCVIIAKDEEEVVSIIETEFFQQGDFHYNDYGERTIEKIGVTDKEKQIVISSFNAG